MKTKVVVKKFLGTGSTMAKLTFYPNRKYYTPVMKVKIEIFTGRNSEGSFDCDSIAEVSEKIQAFYLERNGHDLEVRRLARWYIEYLEEAGLEPPELNKILNDMQSKPSEVQAREGSAEEPVEEVIAEEPVEEVIPEEPVEEVIAEEPEEEVLADEPVDEVVTEEPV